MASSIDGILTGTFTPGLNRLRSNGNKEVVYIPQQDAQQPDGLVSYPGHLLLVVEEGF